MAEKAADFQEKPIKSLVIKLAGPADLPILPRFLAQADGMGFFVEHQQRTAAPLAPA
jgi:hypothetical protein